MLLVPPRRGHPSRRHHITVQCDPLAMLLAQMPSTRSMTTHAKTRRRHARIHCATGSRTGPGQHGGEKSDVGEELVTYAWWPVSNQMYPAGASTRCRPIVSSTTPRFGPRCPPVRDTLSIRNARISAANSSSCSRSRRRSSRGALHGATTNRVTLVFEHGGTSVVAEASHPTDQSACQVRSTRAGDKRALR